MVVVTLGGRRARGELDRLYRAHAREIRRYAQRVLRSPSDADDVVQATFVRAFRALSRGERVDRPRNWLIKIAHNECRRLISSRRPLVELTENVAAAELSESRAEDLQRALNVLAPAQRRALVLRELEGRSYSEIARALSLSESAVETLLFRARRAVREQLELGLTCEEFPAALEAGDRARVRAHARVCADCAKLERQARGKKSRLARLAGWFFLPKLGLGAAVVATTAVVAVNAYPHDPAHPQLPPLQIERTMPKLSTVVAHTSPVPGTRRVPGTSMSHRAAQPEPTIPPGDDPLPVPEPTEPQPPPVPAPPVHTVVPLPEPSPAPTQSPKSDPLPPAAAAVTQPVVQTVEQTVTTATNTVEPLLAPLQPPVQAVQDALPPTPVVVPTLPNVSVR